MGYTILRPSAFMEQPRAPSSNGQMLLERGFTVIIGPGTKPRNFVAVRDVAPFAVQALSEDGLNGRTLEIGGPDNVSNRDVAAMYQVRARQGRIVHVPAGAAQVLATLMRPVHEGVARRARHAAVPDDEMRETWQPGGCWREFPRTLTAVDTFIDERVAEWRRQQRRQAHAERLAAAPRAFLLLQAQHAPLHLAGGRHRQRVDELDLLRVLVGRELAAHVLLQFARPAPRRRRSPAPARRRP